MLNPAAPTRMRHLAQKTQSFISKPHSTHVRPAVSVHSPASGASKNSSDMKVDEDADSSIWCSATTKSLFFSCGKNNGRGKGGATGEYVCGCRGGLPADVHQPRRFGMHHASSHPCVLIMLQASGTQSLISHPSSRPHQEVLCLVRHAARVVLDRELGGGGLGLGKPPRVLH